jgi:diphosphoinositol-polyphosphate diphosphatase
MATKVASLAESCPYYGRMTASGVESPVKMEAAREGRSKQRYTEDGCRLVTGCVPFRVLPSGSVQILLITNRKKSQWIIPKGGWESDETLQEAAARETYEEAGCLGTIEACIMEASYEGKTTSKQYHIYFAMRVEEVLEDYPEANRQRQWVALEEALQLCSRPGMHEAIAALQPHLRRHAAMA